MNGYRDDYELRLRHYVECVTAYRAVEAELLRRADHVVKAQQALDERPWGRELDTVLQMRRGEAFWDRTPLEATPAPQLLDRT